MRRSVSSLFQVRWGALQTSARWKPRSGRKDKSRPPPPPICRKVKGRKAGEIPLCDRSPRGLHRTVTNNQWGSVLSGALRPLPPDVQGQLSTIAPHTIVTQICSADRIERTRRMPPGRPSQHLSRGMVLRRRSSAEAPIAPRPIDCSRHESRSDRHGRLRLFAPTRAHLGRSYARHASIHDRAHADVAFTVALPSKTL